MWDAPQDMSRDASQRLCQGYQLHPVEAFADVSLCPAQIFIVAACCEPCIPQVDSDIFGVGALNTADNRGLYPFVYPRICVVKCGRRTEPSQTDRHRAGSV